VRELPEWALKIFSKGMIAAGNIQEEKELFQICSLAESNLHNNLDKISNFKNDSKRKDVITAKNYYCEHQQQNPHTPRVMLSLGLNEDDVSVFNKHHLFPKISI